MVNISVNLADWAYWKFQPGPLWYSNTPCDSALRKWSLEVMRKGVPPLQVVIALEAVAVAGEIADSLLERARRWAQLSPTADQLLLWNRYYNDPCAPASDLLCECSGSESPESVLAMASFDQEQAEYSLRLLFRADCGEWQALQQIIKGQRAGGQWISQTLDDAFFGESSAVDRGEAHPSALFFFKVLIPCVIKHGRRPDQLLDEFFENEDVNALRQLAALDTLILSHPLVHEKLSEWLKQDDRRYERVFSADRSRRTRVTQKDALKAVMLLLKQICDRWDQVLTQFRAKLNGRSLGPNFQALLNTRSLNATDRQNLIAAYSNDVPSDLMKYLRGRDDQPIEPESWNRRIRDFRTKARPLDVTDITARKTAESRK